MQESPTSNVHQARSPFQKCLAWALVLVCVFLTFFESYLIHKIKILVRWMGYF